ncbi:MAG TPA: ABC transporter permease [Anaerolineae bacterium]|nr:ABC transporter permease [Anaerolineae bacterium]
MSRRRRFLGNWHNLLALLIIGGFLCVAWLAPWLAPQEDPADPTAMRTLPGYRPTALRAPRPPSAEAPLGTAPGGWDVYYGLVWGAWPTLRFGLLTTVLTAGFGISVGALSGYAGGLVSRVLMRVTDAFLTFPAIAGIFLFRTILPEAVETPHNFGQAVLHFLRVDPVMLALIAFSWMPYARLIHANMLTLKQTDYAMAAKTTGASSLRIIFRHLLPNAIAPAIVLAARDVGGMVILEAAFTFIGIGAGLPWGLLLVVGRNWIIGPGGNPFLFWWVFVPATLALILFSLGWNLFGDGLNAVWNPHSIKRGQRI